MRNISHRKPNRYGLVGLPLFDWAARFNHPQLTDGGRWLHRRTGLSPTLANLVAELAGIGRERTL